MDTLNYNSTLEWIREQARELGFAELRVADLDVQAAIPKFQEWLRNGHHGDMHYMSRHAELREHPENLQPGSLRALCVRMDYLPSTLSEDWRELEWNRLDHPEGAVISIYARGRDYHKVLRSRLKTLATRIEEKISPFQFRVFVDSAPLMEVEFARKSGIGWRGKHTLALNREGGSLFFLGEILVDIPFQIDEPISSHCGECQACIDICPTKAIIGPYQLDARRCISYLTIEHHGVIPEEFREAMGNRIYGCDDCQLICPWNKFAQPSALPDFLPRNQLDSSTLMDLFAWTEKDFLEKMKGSAILRIGHEKWQRNIAIALGNALRSSVVSDEKKAQIQETLEQSQMNASPLLLEHIRWALEFSLE